MDWKRAIKTAVCIIVASVAVVVILLLVATMPGCAALGDVREVRTDFAALKQEVGQINIGEIQSALVNLEQRVGDITIGGGGDSVTTWILAAGAAGFYPLAWRPIRKRLERNGHNRDPPK